MALLHVAVSVLTLLSVGHSAPITDCESLTKPVGIQGREQLLGRWTYIADTTDVYGHRFATKVFMDSGWLKLTAAEESDVLHLYQMQKIFDQCFTIRANLTLANNKVVMTTPFNSSDILLNTGCTDCLVLLSVNDYGGIQFRGLQLLSKREKVSADELQEFSKQATCLKLPSPVEFDPEKGFCPDESSSQNPKAFDLNALIDNIDSNDTEAFENFFEKLLTRESVEKLLVRTLTNLLEWLGEVLLS
ncbi:uncharacterized protein LOC103383756 [Cynoglossus semilaevis]|uniref:uncharacterized protein LOC103383756 n=1 Tax=Cynoglossus semilaevis TaxID=244447 RepID=UPI000495C9A5|nr:uncharacterized protein LOC103383756 [Cynoglossus semilaevis]